MQNNYSLLVLACFFIFQTPSVKASQKVAVPSLNLSNIAPQPPVSLKKFDPKDRKRIVDSATSKTSFATACLLSQPKKEFSDSDFSDSDEKPKNKVFSPATTSAFYIPGANHYSPKICSSPKACRSPKLSPIQSTTH